MPEPLKSYVRSLPRHFRFVILVPLTITEMQLRYILLANLNIWGGRYNPIIPVKDNKISAEWLATIQYYDPDIVFYQRGMDIEIIKSLFSFYPRHYQEYLDDRRPYFPGVNIHSLLHPEVDGKISKQGNLKLCHTEEEYKFGLTLMGFYQINLGLQDLYQGEDKFLRGFDVTVITKNSATNILETLVTFNPYFKSLLSTQFINTTFLETNHYEELNRTEIIVYDEKEFIDDLFYFWNRQRYLKPSKQFQQIVITTSELGELLKNKNLEWLFFRINNGKSFTLTSRTLSESELRVLRDQLRVACPTCAFSYSKIVTFPYEVEQTKFLITDKLRKTTHVLVGKQDHINIPKLIFNSQVNKIDGPYVLDIELERNSDNQHRFLKFPYHTPLHYLVTTQKARINLNHIISLFIEDSQTEIKINIPNDNEIIRTLFYHREIEGKLVKLPCRGMGISNAGQKLSAFLALFDNDWDRVEQFISNHFWLDLFRYNSSFKESVIPSGKGAFSYQDLKTEVQMLYKKYADNFKKEIEATTNESVTIEYINVLTEKYIKDDFKTYVDPSLQYLIEKKGLFIGMKVACSYCGANKFYSLSELSDTIDCKGCYNKIMPGIKSPIYYKLSETIVSNLLSDQTKNSKTFDGNYVVMRTLNMLKNDHKWCHTSFIWSPPLDIDCKTVFGNLYTDLDIIAILEGKLVYGEAKNNGKEFYKKEIDHMIWVGNNLHPDVIVLAYASGKLTDQVEKIKAGITNPSCEVISIKTWRPWYRFQGLFGMPEESTRSDRH